LARNQTGEAGQKPARKNAGVKPVKTADQALYGP